MQEEFVQDGETMIAITPPTEDTQLALPHISNLDKLMEHSKMLAKSTIVPITYQNRPENCFVAMEMSQRTGLPVMSIMQNLYVIQGKPSWSGQAVCSMIRNSSQFQDVELHYVGQENTDNWGAYVTATRRSTGQKLKGATVTIGTAKQEGWYAKAGSKWKTMPEIMLGYRAYTWFGRIYAPELMMGLQSREELEDVSTYEQVEQPINPFGK